jgi:mannose/cellobiose epimerase-like protein (N-acyl-D-glucosamine 2-epimerase family)
MVALTRQDRGRLEQQAGDVLGFARASAASPLGFAWLDDQGRPVPGEPVHLWVTCRMTHVYGLAALRGDASSVALVEHGVTALWGRLHDQDFGGWFASVDEAGPVADTKEAYGHCFVVLAAATATALGVPRAQELLHEALEVLTTRFWDADAGMVADVWDREWTTLDPYRGVNANMHTVEALLAAASVTGDAGLLAMGARIVERVVHGFAGGNDHRLPEHYDPTWQAIPGYNRDDPRHPFRPFGVTTGHLLEWSRLTLQTAHALGDAAPEWMRADAIALFARAVAEGWTGGDHPGFAYTTDFDGAPVVRERMHWVVAEGMAAAWVLADVTGDDGYAAWFRTWWDLATESFVDEADGSWRHELDETNQPSATVWRGRPDAYHAYQALILPLLPLESCFVAAVLAERAAAGQEGNS